MLNVCLFSLTCPIHSTHAVSANGTVSATTFSVTVNDTNPIW